MTFWEVEKQKMARVLDMEEKLRLEKASLALRGLESTMIRTRVNDLLAKLKEDARTLEELIIELKETNKDPDRLAASLERVSRSLGDFMLILAKAG